MDKLWFKCALNRALRTVCQSLASNLPIGFVVTPVMIQYADWTVVYVIIAWLLTGLLAGLSSFLTSLAGLPEVEMERANDTGN